MTAGYHGADYADPVVIPITLTIPDPRPRRPTGMSRLRRAVVMPAIGWHDGPAAGQSSFAFFPADMFSIPSAGGQEPRPKRKSFSDPSGRDPRASSSADQTQSANGPNATDGLIQPAQGWLPLLLDEPPAIIRPPLENFPTNPTQPPGPGFEWRGQPGSDPGGPRGSWYNPGTGETLRPDMNHGKPIGPHYDYRDPDGNWYRWFQNGKIVPKA